MNKKMNSEPRNKDFPVSEKLKCQAKDIRLNSCKLLTKAFYCIYSFTRQNSKWLKSKEDKMQKKIRGSILSRKIKIV